MDEFISRKKKVVAKIEVKVASDEAGFDVKVLEFDCSITRYSFMRRATEIGRELAGFGEGGEAWTPEKLESVMRSEREAFEALAPGRFDEFFAFLGEDLADMAKLIGVMLRVAREKSVEARKAEIEPEVPNGPEVV